MFHWLVAVIAGFFNEKARKVILYQQEMIRALETELRGPDGNKRISFPKATRTRIGKLGAELGTQVLKDIEIVFSPYTILKWHRQRKAEKYQAKHPRAGRPRKATESEIQLIAQMAQENKNWGYHRISGALKNLNIHLSFSTVQRILKELGFSPAPQRGKQLTWKEFIERHAQTLSAADFTTKEVWTIFGLMRVHLLFVMQVGSRKVELAGVIPEPNGRWMTQIARNLTDFEDGFLKDQRYLTIDRGSVFTEQFRQILKSEGVKTLRLPPKSPNLNSHIERFMRSLKGECLDQMIFFGQDHLERVTRDYLVHYHFERNHQGLNNELIEPVELPGTGTIHVNQRAGGLLKYYYREAA